MLISIVAFSGFAQTSDTTSPLYSFGPVTDYKAAIPNLSDAIHLRRGERYNSPVASGPELGEDSEATLWDLPETHFKKDPMPFDGSDAVVTGRLTAGQAYLSNDKRNIYSEFKVAIEEIVKNPDAVHLGTNDSIDVHRKGGAIKLPSGKVLIRGALADSMPQIGKRYLLFLKYGPDTADYDIVTGYELDANEVYRLDDFSYGESNHQKITHPLRKEGVGESQLLNRAKSKLSPKDGDS